MALVKELLLTDSRSRIEEWIRSRTLAATLPTGDTLCRVLGEFPCVVTLDDLSIAPHLVMHGYWETWVTMCLAKRVKPGWQCIDVGASFGYFTLLLAELGAEKIEAWEPNPKLRPLLEQTFALNGLAERVHLRGRAAGAETAEVYLARSAHNYGSARVVTEYATGGAMLHVPVGQRALGQSTTLERVDFVKIDAEGMEPEVWQGLGDKLPQSALLEWTPSRYADAPAFLALVREQGYRIGRVNSKGDLDKVSGDELLGTSGWMAIWLEKWFEAGLGK